MSSSTPQRVTSRATRSIDAPVDTVWAVLSDHEGMSTWAPGIRVTLDRPGGEARDGVGAVRRVALPGPAPAIVEEITAFQPGRRLAYRALSGVPFRNYGGDVTLTRDGDGTTVVYAVSVGRRLRPVDRAATRLIASVLLSRLVRAVERSG